MNIISRHFGERKNWETREVVQVWVARDPAESQGRGHKTILRHHEAIGKFVVVPRDYPIHPYGGRGKIVIRKTADSDRFAIDGHINRDRTDLETVEVFPASTKGEAWKRWEEQK